MYFYFLSILFCLPAFALEAVVVSAPAENPVPITDQIDGADWERHQGRPENALALVPGLSFTANGGPGQNRALFLRGARSEDTLVLLDGIPMNDPLTVARSFDLSQMPMMEIDHILVRKGPQSVLYGSDAMGGVVEIFSRRDAGTPRARLEGGSFGTLRGRASYLGFQAGYERSDGFSAADAREGNTEKDGLKAWNLGGTKEIPLAENASLRLLGFFRRSVTDTDANGGPGGDSIGTFTRNSLLAFRAEALGLHAGYEWNTAASLQSSQRNDNTFAPASYRGNLWRAEARLRRPFRRHTPTLGLTFTEETGQSNDLRERQRARTAGIFAQEELRLGRWTIEAGGRLDFHDRFGRAATFRGALGYWLWPETLRAKTAFGSAFKAPSLYQLYAVPAIGASPANPNLTPSRALGGDRGLELFQEDWSAELGFYANRFRNLIDYDFGTQKYFNVGAADTRGLEAAMSYRWGFFTLRNALTTIHAVDRSTGLKLLRRPGLANALEVGYRKGDFVGITASARYVGRRIDTHPVTFARQAMPPFAVFGAQFFHRLNADLKLLVRGENLFNRHYQETSGYGTAGLSGYLGIEAEL